jgi:iron-sulfur cluster assembly protein
MTKKNILTVSAKAIIKIRELLEKRAKPAAGIKVNVQTGGCSGLKYKIEYADEILKFDEVVEVEDLKIVIDAKAVIYLLGSEMDFVEDDYKAGFVFSNPNEKGKCGCGESFNV